MNRESLRAYFGDALLVAILIANLVCGAVLILTGGFEQGDSLPVGVPGTGFRLTILPKGILGSFLLLNAAAFLRFRRRRREVTEEEKGRMEERLERRVREMSQAHADLVAHHKITKRMLQSRTTDEVFGALVDGIAGSFNFHGTLAGKVSGEGFLVFPGEAAPVTGVPLRVPLWDPHSLIARIFWAGSNVLHRAPLELPHLPDEEPILGSTPAYFLPVTRRMKTRCAEAKNCGVRTCPNFHSENLNCWLDRLSLESFTPGADPEDFRDRILDCLRCEIFPSGGLVVVRSLPEGKAVTPESVRPIATLSPEADLSLEVVNLYENMKIMAVTDGLTGLFNHREFYNALRRELERARRYRHTISLLVIDVDDFKAFNDRFGHPAGDLALRRISELLRKYARATDIIARYGGEEFAVILPESTRTGAYLVAERIKAEVEKYNFAQNVSGTVHLTVSIGIYTSQGGEVSEDQMVALADEAAYTAKNSGKNRVVVKANV